MEQNSAAVIGRLFVQILAHETDRIALIKMRPGRQWHSAEKRWSLPDTPENRAWLTQSPVLPTEPIAPAPNRGSSHVLATEQLPICVLRDGRIYYRVAWGKAEVVANIKKIADYRWHQAEKYWSVPDTETNRAAIRQLHHAQCPSRVPAPNRAPTATDRVQGLSIGLHSEQQQYLCIRVPSTCVDTHLETVKKIHGRRWNKQLLAWEVPYTLLTIRFVRKYLADIQWTFTPADDLPERLPSEGVFSQTHKKKV